MKKFHGLKKQSSYFEGWYFKHQNGTDTIAIIPSYHIDNNGKKWCALQVIDNTNSYNVNFKITDFKAAENKLDIQIEKNKFSDQGCYLDIKTKNLELKGSLKYDNSFVPVGDIMGPFQFVPFMQCRHSVFSIIHTVMGELTLNGKVLDFSNGTGYIEGDRGHSFPKSYTWTQWNNKEDSIMVSVAHIPLGVVNFTGCIGIVFLDGIEYRLATYCGVKIIYFSKDKIILKQKNLYLEIYLLEECSSPLLAPSQGTMSRTIHESAASVVRYRFSKNNKILLDLVTNQASYESDL